MRRVDGGQGDGEKGRRGERETGRRETLNETNGNH